MAEKPRSYLALDFCVIFSSTPVLSYVFSELHTYGLPSTSYDPQVSVCTPVVVD